MSRQIQLANVSSLKPTYPLLTIPGVPDPEPPPLSRKGKPPMPGEAPRVAVLYDEPANEPLVLEDVLPCLSGAGGAGRDGVSDAALYAIALLLSRPLIYL